MATSSAMAILGHRGELGVEAARWGFGLGHGSLQGGLEDLGFGEVLEGQTQSTNAGNGDGTILGKWSRSGRAQDDRFRTRHTSYFSF